MFGLVTRKEMETFKKNMNEAIKYIDAKHQAKEAGLTLTMFEWHVADKGKEYELSLGEETIFETSTLSAISEAIEMYKKTKTIKTN